MTGCYFVGWRDCLLRPLFFVLSSAPLTAVPCFLQSAGQSGHNTVGDAPPSPAEVSHAIALAGGYLERACGPDGKFAYKVDIGSGKESPSYDIVRAGAMYGLATPNRSHPDRQAVAALVRAARFLQQNYIGPGIRPGQLVIWSQPLADSPEGRSSSKSRERYAELGGTGLGLVALAAAREVDPNSVPLEELQALGRFALFLQRDDGRFVHKCSYCFFVVGHRQVRPALSRRWYYADG